MFVVVLFCHSYIATPLDRFKMKRGARAMPDNGE